MLTPFAIAMLSIHTSPLAQLGGKEAGGMNVYVRELSLTLGQRGMTVDIFTRSQSDTTPMVVPIAPGVRVVSLPAGPTTPYDKYHILHHLPEFLQRMLSFGKEAAMRYDIIHSHYWISGVAALQLRPIWQSPVIQMFHTLGAMKNRVARGKEETEHMERMRIEHTLLQESDVIVAATPLDRAHMLQIAESDNVPVHVIPCGVNLHQFYPMPPAQARVKLNIAPDEQILLCTGRMEPLKGMDWLIRAASIMIERQPSLRGRLRVLLIGGESETNAHAWNTEQQRLDALRNELGVVPHVTFLGKQAHEDLVLFYAAADVCVVPSLYESFGLVALEAQACGKCVVASDAGGLRYLIEDGKNGLLFPPTQADILAEKLLFLLQNEVERRRMEEAALQHAQSLSWDHVTNEIIQRYQHTVAAYNPTIVEPTEDKPTIPGYIPM